LSSTKKDAYAQSGVNTSEADLFVEKIAGLAKSTLNSKVKAAVGGYASLYALNKNQFLAASTDGVGTKLKLAFELNQHTTVGIDLVAMSVNDVLCVGATPMFFLDYFATGRLERRIGVEVLEGIVQGCKEAGCALVGGETAEMPGFYQDGEYDLAGFAVGTVDAKSVLPKKEVRPGDVILGLSSTGFHSNGFSLIRQLLSSDGNADLKKLALTPTRIYVKSLQPLLQKGWIKGLAHITGSGFLNIPRISTKVDYQITMPPLDSRPQVFQWVFENSGLDSEELYKTFNMGVGMVVIVDPKKKAQVIAALKKGKEKVWDLGLVQKRKTKHSQVLIEDRDCGSCSLAY